MAVLSRGSYCSGGTEHTGKAVGGDTARDTRHGGNAAGRCRILACHLSSAAGGPAPGISRCGVDLFSGRDFTSGGT